MKKIVFIMSLLLCSTSLANDPPISYDRAIPNNAGGYTYYKGGRVIGSTIPNNTGSHTYYGGSGVEFRGFQTNMGGTRWQATPSRKATPSTKSSLPSRTSSSERSSTWNNSSYWGSKPAYKSGKK